MEIVFILDKPARPANVGAAARALKTMGYHRWRIVASDAHTEDEAEWVAHGAEDVLQSVECFATLNEAIADCDLVVATTARRRGCVRPYHSPEQLRGVLQQQLESVQRVAVLFGCEASGLDNEAIDTAHLLSAIPLVQPQPSLNLAQAVMIYSYALSGLVQRADEDMASGAGLGGELSALRQRLARLSARVGAADDAKLQEWLHDRTGLLTDRDTRMLHTLLSDIERTLNAALTDANRES